MQTLGQSLKPTMVVSYTAAAASDVNGTRVDMQNYEGVIFIVGFGTSAIDNGIKAQQDTATGMGDAADLLGTSLLLDATETVAMLEIYRPRERYVRPVIIRGTSSTIEFCVAIQYKGRKLPVDIDAITDVAFETHTSPAEGTA